MSKALFITGWGLRNDIPLQKLLETRGWNVDIFNLDETTAAPSLAGYARIFMSGPMGAGLADNLGVGRHALAFKNYFVSQQPDKNGKLRVYAFGRGALIALASQVWLPFDSTTLRARASSPSGPWRKITLPEQDSKRIMGLELCERPWDKDSPFFSQLSPWLQSEGALAGWRVGQNLFISDVDIFAVKEPSILPDYGYFDSSTISPAGDFLDKLLV